MTLDSNGRTLRRQTCLGKILAPSYLLTQTSWILMHFANPIINTKTDTWLWDREKVAGLIGGRGGGEVMHQTDGTLQSEMENTFPSTVFPMGSNTATVNEIGKLYYNSSNWAIIPYSICGSTGVHVPWCTCGGWTSLCLPSYLPCCLVQGLLSFVLHMTG